MQYIQKKGSSRVHLFLKRESLEYRFQNTKSEYNMFLDYEEIPFESGKFRNMEAWLRNLGFILIAVGAIATADCLLNDKSGSAWLWIIIGAICCLVYYLRKVEFFYFNTDKGRLLIINDATGQEAVAMIKQRRCDQIRERHGVINWANSAEHELKRFRWMEERGVISPGEFREIETTIRLKRPEQQDPFELN